MNSSVMKATNPDTEAKSQTSLMTTITSVKTDSNLTSPMLDNQSATVFHPTNFVDTSYISKNKHRGEKLSGGTSIDAYGTNSYTVDKDFNVPSGHFCASKICPHLIKSASSGGLFESQAFDPNSCLNENVSNDKADGSSSNVVVSCGDGKNQTMKWNATLIDIEMTEIMLQSLDDHIKIKRDKITKDVSQREEMVDKLISDLTQKSDIKSSKKIRREYEAMNKNAEKSIEKAQMELEQLEYKRFIVNEEGIPWGVKPADYVKNISRKDARKKRSEVNSKDESGTVTKLLKGYSMKSASAENVCHITNGKSNETSLIKAWLPKSFSERKNKDMSQKSATSNESPHCSISNDQNIVSKSCQYQSLKKPSSAGASSAISCDVHGGDKCSQMKKSNSNSVSSFTGRDRIQENMETHEFPRNQSFCGTSVDETQKSDDVPLSRLQSLQDDMNTVKKEIHEIRFEFQRFQCENDNLRLDMDTNAELNSQKMQNAIERVDRLERILDILRQQCQIEFCSWKEGFRSLEEKLDYRLTTTRRDLQDNIDACNNSILLVEKRTEQLPFMSSRSGRSDVKIITDHLCNLIVSLVAFFMLLISSGFHLLIRFLNIGATISQNRNTLLFLVIIIAVVGMVIMKWSLFNELITSISSHSDNPVL